MWQITIATIAYINYDISSINTKTVLPELESNNIAALESKSIVVTNLVNSDKQSLSAATNESKNEKNEIIITNISRDSECDTVKNAITVLKCVLHKQSQSWWSHCQ